MRQVKKHGVRSCIMQAVAARQRSPADPETPRRQRHLARPPLDALAGQGLPRAEWMTRASRAHGYSLKEIASAAGLHYSTVSRIIKGWEKSYCKT